MGPLEEDLGKWKLAENIPEKWFTGIEEKPLGFEKQISELLFTC